MKLSVVIVARNGEQHIARCIESVVTVISRMRDAEVVLVESRSTTAGWRSPRDSSGITAAS